MFFQSISFIASCPLLLGVVAITSRIILLVLSLYLSSGVIWRLKLKLMLWSSLSKKNSPSSSFLTFIVLSFLLILKLQGEHLHLMPLGLISISFLICSLPLHKGHSNTMFLDVSFCSSFRLTTAGSSSDSSKSSGIGFFWYFTTHLWFCFLGWHLYDT